VPWPGTGKGKAALALPPGTRAGGLSLIAYAQDPATLALLGAARTEVAP
jgi:hypothetical protein